MPSYCPVFVFPALVRWLGVAGQGMNAPDTVIFAGSFTGR
jgi:hypothetical protein